MESAIVIVPQEFSKDEMHYEIIDMLGKSVYKNKIAIGEEKFIIEKGNLVSGIYFLNVFSNNNSVVAKILIQ